MAGRGIAFALGLLCSSALAPMGMAQQVTGTPGSASATTTISGKQLPPPDPKFGGVIKDIKKLQEAQRNNKVSE
jgi:hypothetical protein